MKSTNKICYLMMILQLFIFDTEASQFISLPTYEFNKQRSDFVTKIPIELILKDKYRRPKFLYHGTSMQRAISIVSTQEVIIGNNNNIAVNGRGWYFYKSLIPAMGYSRSTSSRIGVDDIGMVIPVEIKKFAIVLDWQAAKWTTLFQEIISKNDEEGAFSFKRTFDEIGKLGVDIIHFGNEYIVLNKNAIEIPETMPILSKHYSEVLNKSHDSATRDYSKDLLDHISKKGLTVKNCSDSLKSIDLN